MRFSRRSAAPAGLLPARRQMAFSLGLHFVLACFEVASPAMIFAVHLRRMVRSDPVAIGLAKRWSKTSAVLFAIGAVSGTVLSFEMGLLWPGLRYVARAGDASLAEYLRTRAAPLIVVSALGGIGQPPRTREPFVCGRSRSRAPVSPRALRRTIITEPLAS